MSAIEVGAAPGDEFRIEVLGRQFPTATDFWDGNWLNTQVTARVGAFRCKVAGTIRTTEIKAFRVQLQRLYEELLGQATFATMERWIALSVVGDGRGHLRIEGELQDEPGCGNMLRFHLPEIDQTQLFDVIARLCEIEEEFPTIDAPAA